MQPNFLILTSVVATILLASVGSEERTTASQIEKEPEEPNGYHDATQEETNDFLHLNMEEHHLNHKEDETLEEFMPTEEWQRIKPGQSIPRGLHVRMNLQTGEKEAKLLSENEMEDFGDKASATPEEKQNTALIQQENGHTAAETPQAEGDPVDPGRLLKMKQAMEEAMAELEQQDGKNSATEGPRYWKNGDKEGMVNMKKDTFSREELKEALKKFKASADDVKEKKAEDIKKKFRSIEELKKDFKEMKMDVKTDNEILRELFERYQKNDQLEERQIILTDLEYYLHQIDNAKDFADMGGLDLVIKDLNHTAEVIRSEAAFVLGSATQSNPKVQIRVIEGGALQQLIRMLPTEASVQVRSRVLYALSSVVRQFPYAQKRLLELGGLAAMSSVFKQDDTQRIRLKVLTLLTDLVIEQEHASAMDDTTTDATQLQRKEQYKQVPLIQSLQEQGWCDLIPAMLDVQEHDSREKVLVCIRTLMDYCKPAFSKHLQKLSKYREEYKNLSKTETDESPDDQYYTEMLKLVDTLIVNLRIKEEL